MLSLEYRLYILYHSTLTYFEMLPTQNPNLLGMININKEQSKKYVVLYKENLSLGTV